MCDRALVLKLQFVLYSHSILILCSVRVHSLSSVYVNTIECPVGLAEKQGGRFDYCPLELDHGSEGFEGLGDNNCRTPGCGYQPLD